MFEVLYQFCDCLFDLFLNVGFWRPFCFVMLGVLAILALAAAGAVWFYEHDYKGKHTKEVKQDAF